MSEHKRVLWLAHSDPESDVTVEQLTETKLESMAESFDVGAGSRQELSEVVEAILEGFTEPQIKKMTAIVARGLLLPHGDVLGDMIKNLFELPVQAEAAKLTAADMRHPTARDNMLVHAEILRKEAVTQGAIQ